MPTSSLTADELQQLADQAVALVSGPMKLSAADAVASACKGRGLNREQLHRVSTMSNRALLSREKVSARTEGMVPSRWKTSSPEEVAGTDTVAMAAVYRNEEKTTTPELRDMHTDSIISALRRLNGLAGTDTEPVLRDSVLGSSPSASTPATFEEVREMLDRQAPDPAGTKVSFSRLQTAMFPARSSSPHEDARIKASEAAHASRRLDEVKEATRTAWSDLRARADVGMMKTESSRYELAEVARDLLRREPVTPGEVVALTLRAITDAAGADSVLAAAARQKVSGLLFQSVGVDPLAYDGELRDERGLPKTSAIATARKAMECRDEVLAAKLNPDGDLARTAREYVSRLAETRVLEAARDSLAEALR